MHRDNQMGCEGVVWCTGTTRCEGVVGGQDVREWSGAQGQPDVRVWFGACTGTRCEGVVWWMHRDKM